MAGFDLKVYDDHGKDEVHVYADAETGAPRDRASYDADQVLVGGGAEPSVVRITFSIRLLRRASIDRIANQAMRVTKAGGVQVMQGAQNRLNFLDGVTRVRVTTGIYDAERGTVVASDEPLMLRGKAVEAITPEFYYELPTHLVTPVLERITEMNRLAEDEESD